MELRPEFQIKTVIKALTDVVLPAIDADNMLAQEQGKLAVAVLGMALRNMPLMYSYDRTELSELVVLAAELCRMTEGREALAPARERLCMDLEIARSLVAQPGAAPSELNQMVFALRASIGTLVSEGCRELEGGAAAGLGRAVIDHAERQILRERSLLIDQGWEPAPDRIPAIHTLLETS